MIYLRSQTVNDLPFDLDEAQRSNILISGANSQGKTLLACQLASLLKSQGWKVSVFDNSGAWRDKSDLEGYYRVTSTKQNIPIGPNMIYDTSLLKADQQIRLLTKMLYYYWVSRVNGNPTQWLMIFLEEAQLVMKTVRSKASFELLRIMTSGRNQKIRVVGITCDLALIDASFIRLAQQRYHFKLAIEENAKRKFRAYYGAETTKRATKLRIGECLYILNDEISLEQIPLFETQIKTVRR